MPVNKWFNQFTNKREQSLFGDLMAEVIEIHGMNCIYIPRDSQETDLFYGEDPLAKFDRWFEMAAFIKDAAGFGGKATMQKWGITMQQSITIQIAISEFTQAVGQELNPNRPKEGDLLYFPYGLPGQYLLEIKYVNQNVPFVEFGQDYIYEIDCRMFTYGNEEIKTGLSDVDGIMDTIQQRLDIQIGSGTGTFLAGEVVFQGASFASSSYKAVLKSINGSTLTVANQNGTYSPAANLIGNTSGASYASMSNVQDIQNDKQAQNQLIQTQADPIFVKEPRNPFDKGRQ